MYRVAICDDEKILRETLRYQLEAYQEASCNALEIIAYDSGESLLKSKLDFDVIFLDVCMGELDGIETARRLRVINKDVILLFLTSYGSTVYDAFEVNAFRYLLKPIDQNKLFESLDKVLQLLKEKDRHCLIIKTELSIVKLHYKDILYFESMGKKVMVHSCQGTYITPMKIGELENTLKGYGFFRCHKGYIVNLAEVREYTNEEIVMENNDRVYLSRLKANAFKAALITHLGRGRKI